MYDLELINTLINKAVIEMLMIVYACLLFKYLLDIKNMKYVWVICFIKIFVVNLLITYMQYVGLFKGTTEIIVIISNITLSVVFFMVIAAASEVDLLKVLILNFILEITGVSIVVCPFLGISVITKFDNIVINENGVVLKGILILLIGVLVVCGLIYLASLIIKKYSEKSGRM